MAEHAPNTTRRIGWNTQEIAAALGRSADALRRRVERAAEPGPDGSLMARIDLGIVAYKRAGRWVFVVPPELAARLG